MRKIIILGFIFGFLSLAGATPANAQWGYQQSPCCLSYGWHDSGLAAYGPFSFGGGWDRGWNNRWGNSWGNMGYLGNSWNYGGGWDRGWNNRWGNSWGNMGHFGNTGFLGANLNFGFGW